MKKIYLAWLHSIWLSHKKLFLLFQNKNNYKEIFLNLDYNILKSINLNDKQINKILDNQKKCNLEEIKERLIKRNVKIITKDELEYPEKLKQVFNPPFLFYLRWNISNSPKLSIIWSRKISSYWINTIEKIIPWLSNYFTIISWWAAWCDSKAHIETLKSKWETISIIWTWIDIDYPVSNKKLYDEIVITWWWVFSSFPVWEVGNPYNFPVRNEIVAWLSDWILIIEAQEKSWSLITAKIWLDMWKEVFAIPSEIFKTNWIWTNWLIKKWEAKLVQTANDILEEYNISNIKTDNKRLEFTNQIEEEIYNIILVDNLNIDEISKRTKIETKLIGQFISNLEITWLIKKNVWWKYQIV